jgi:3-oxoacyl-[acyl-carrier protein] reductase
MDKRIIWVTGGSRGIGRAICRAFAGAETHVYFNYSSAGEAAAETEKLVAAAGGTATGARVDVLVNNAGVTRDGLLVRMKALDWDTVLDTNLKGAFNCMKLVAKAMIRQRSGRIINVSSVVGVRGNPGQANYVASKAGIIGLAKAAALELASRGITVNVVAPGYIETDMTAALGEKAREVMLAQIPLGRAGSPEDVAAAVVFLSSQQAAYITGQVIHVNGGMYM